jgi:hypothetical protein
MKKIKRRKAMSSYPIVSKLSDRKIKPSFLQGVIFCLIGLTPVQAMLIAPAGLPETEWNWEEFRQILNELDIPILGKSSEYSELFMKKSD